MKTQVLYVIKLIKNDDSIYSTYYVNGISIEYEYVVPYNTIYITGLFKDAKHFTDLDTARKVLVKLHDNKAILQYNTTLPEFMKWEIAEVTIVKTEKIIN